MSYFMDYGEDWPPKPSRRAVRREIRKLRKWSLRRWIAFWLIFYTVVYISATIAIHVRGPAPFDPYGGEHTTYTTTTVTPAPHPAKIHRHP